MIPAKLLSEHDQDEAHAVAWMREATNEAAVRIWNAIQDLGGTPELEIVSRFAQLGMCHALLLAREQLEEP
jgi:hypothetical protein